MRRINLQSTPLLANKRGDTIVEVLIAIGIVSLVLTSAYALTNRNVQTSQKVQEQGQAQKLVEQQIELLRANPTITDAELDGKCLSRPYGDVSSSCEDYTAAGSGAEYTIKFDASNSPVYAVSATWDTIGGQESQITMYYRR